ncbi:MAG: hypothetical protein MUF64_11190 [Polyangiaceae bacterium]|jgi:hypothetical protein|nr:hypothetical protein [Polyangiaceae bacterium]
MIDPNDPLNAVGGDNLYSSNSGARSTRELLGLHLSGQGVLTPEEQHRVTLALSDPRTPGLLAKPYKQGPVMDASKLSEEEWIKWRRGY